MIKRLKPFLGRYGLNILILVAAVLASVSAVVFFSAKFVVRVFGNIPLHQVLFNLNPQGAGDMVSAFVHAHAKTIQEYVAMLLGTFIVVWSITVLAIRRVLSKFGVRWRALKWGDTCFRLCTLLVLIAANVFFIQYVDQKFNLKKFLAHTDSPFIEENYAALNVNSVEHTGGRKRNLIVLMLESMESGFANASVYGENLIPELQALAQEGLELKGYRQTQGGYFTIDGMSAQFLGMPLLQMPAQIHNMKNNFFYKGLLSKTFGVFNVLKADGYVTASFLGTSKEFTHMGLFLQDHGIDERYFAEDWPRLGFPLNDDVRGRWSYSDDFLFARFEEWLAKPKDCPFAVFLGTIDTHSPVGFTPAAERVKGNHQEAIQHASRLVARFIAWAKTQPWYADTTIYIAGDHPWQDGKSAFTKLTQKDPNRGIYSAFLNPVRTDLKMRPCGFSAMDIAPTILNAMGVSFTSDFHGQPSHAQLGLGRSLFDEGENLVCRYGKEGLTQRLSEYSFFYNTLQ